MKDILRSREAIQEERQEATEQKSFDTSIWTIWAKIKKYEILRRGGRHIAHLFGIWASCDLIELGRKTSSAHGIRKLFLQLRYERRCEKFHVHIPNFSNIGEGFALGHPFCVAINGAAVIGRHCTIYQGVTIGSVRGGKRNGVPILEDRVVVCANAVVVGGITIGHDTLIAANAFVDFDVPPPLCCDRESCCDPSQGKRIQRIYYIMSY